MSDVRVMKAMAKQALEWARHRSEILPGSRLADVARRAGIEGDPNDRLVDRGFWLGELYGVIGERANRELSRDDAIYIDHYLTRLTNEWFADRGRQNPGKSVLTGPGWDTARQKLAGAARGTRKNPSGLTARGERMYDAIVRSYAGDPRAKEIASRTVLSRARTTHGLRRNGAPVDVYVVTSRMDDTVRKATAADIARGPDLVVDGEDCYLATIDDEGQVIPLEETDLARYKKNPGDLELAKATYESFHRYAPRKIGEFSRGFEIPRRMVKVGPAKWVTYRSGKVDPSTLQKPARPINYIHEHDAGVTCYVPVDAEVAAVEYDGVLEMVDVPREFRDVDALTFLGHNLGFAFEIDGDEIEAEGMPPLPELYCVPNGKCLLVIQDRREVLAMIWGGALGVFPRGIDG